MEKCSVVGSGKKIVLIEDDDIDVMVFKRAMKQIEYRHSLKVFTNGYEFLEFIDNNSWQPEVLFLDLNTPRVNGIELLKTLIKYREKYFFPVVVLSSSDNDNDIEEAYKNMANGYITKSVTFNTFVEDLKIVLQYWDTVHIPKGVNNE